MTKTKTHKTGVVLKQLDEAGRGLARIATLSAIDSDGDTYAPGAFGEQHAKLLAAHNWQSVPLGKARVFEQGDEALAELRFNLDSEHAREWHAALKFDLDAERSGGPILQEWSYGFRIVDAAQETRGEERVRVLKRLVVHEVSPVVVGAGVATTTLALKGRPFRDQLEVILAAAEDLAGRAGDIAALRAAEGRGLPAGRIAKLRDLKSAIEAILAAEEAPRIEARRLVARNMAIRAGIDTALGGCCKVDRTLVKGRRLGALLRRLRDEQELSNEDLARAAGIDVSTMGAILGGDINCPPLRRLRGLARRLDVPVSRLRAAAEADGCDYEG
ncbi:MAG: helix-turn-helix domain-containing protein [Kiloniellaceae bacterium]